MRDGQLKLGIRLVKLQEELKKETTVLCQCIEKAIIDFTNENGVFVQEINISYEGEIDEIEFGGNIALGDFKIKVATNPTVSPAIKSIPIKTKSNCL